MVCHTALPVTMAQEHSIKTIVACATGHIQAGISIVRISGPLASLVCQKLTNKGTPEPNRAICRTLFDEEGAPIDQSVVLFFKGPASFTGEDLLELHTHGSPYIVSQVIENAISHGAILAKPGEFSERAFLNGKMDLVQAESIADLIASQTKAQAAAALGSLQGVFSVEVANLQEALSLARTQLEAAIDFSEQDIAVTEEQALKASIKDLLQKTEDLIVKVKRAIVTQSGVKIVMLGEPNVGKSSLLNQLTQQDSAIVTDIPGTTRDTLKATISHQGQAIDVIDTAGLRESSDPIESIGIKKAIEAVQSANVIWLVVDASLATAQKVEAQITHVPQEKRDVVVVVGNKSDLLETGAPSSLFLDAVISAKSGENLEQLLDQSLKQCVDASEKSPFSARQRHLAALETFKGHLTAALSVPSGQTDLAAEDMRYAQKSLSEITGEFHTEDLLDAIFGTFCLGK